MTATIAKDPNRWLYCPFCKRGITRASDGRGGTVVVERCPLPVGTIALTLPLIYGEPMLATPCAKGKAHYRPHRCIHERAHSAASFDGKQDPSKLSNISYRTFTPRSGNEPKKPGGAP
jgi:hypothetical protein